MSRLVFSLLLQEQFSTSRRIGAIWTKLKGRLKHFNITYASKRSTLQAILNKTMARGWPASRTFKWRSVFFPFWMLNVIIIKKSFDVYYNYTLHTIHMHSTAHGGSCAQLYYLCGVSMSLNLFQFPLGDFSFVGVQFRQSGGEKVIINNMKREKTRLN